jgi:Terminase large subunit, T4likevirus-type, N-terminal
MEALKCAYLNPGTVGLIGSPTYPLLRDTTRSTFLEVLEANRVPYTFNKSDNDLTLPECGSKILFRTLMEPERLRGYNLAWFWVDELTYTKQAAWKRLVARLRHKKARHKAGIATWTPKGFDWVYTDFVSAERKSGYEAVFAAPKENEINLVEGYYDQLRHDYDERFYAQEVEGKYLNVFSGQAYFNFDRGANVRADLDFDPRLPLHWSLDFNVDPMCSILAQVVDVTTERDRRVGRERNEIRVLDEIVLRDARTVHACKAFSDRVEALRKRFDSAAFRSVYIYGDAAGNGRRTQSSETDWQQVRAHLRAAGFEAFWRVPDADPPLRGSVTSVTAAILNDAGERALLIAPRCIELIKDLEQVGWAKDAAGNSTGELAKSDPDRTHTSDALRYMVHKMRKPVGGPRSGQIV